ncbi:glycine--tRNA ligase subunit beta [Thalassobacter stenotrophicus]|uniref:Glycine--tRNA ligase beta subunit n=2 Tax=Thalassobacter stenotrophicus TaxID=266809 RepID=A0A0P1F1K1_9RHOB|nr:glycine--tRNA ligase subunit beta [Thalassobacter stenotrophicus]PVZ48208.1 glycine--tRNA ligase subunit beta [Thalassobacter stenotrophicus]CUH61092.1 Glycine--tRNA ligase beta subunit [Thalassobacter stenotrophicus]SHI56731.1 glycyl-tRNA synthetase beta chain [Thalassobacter stenotrophicus DSM 16310]
MPDLLLELFSEEIPARMQARAAADLQKRVTDGLVEAGLTYSGAVAHVTPRRLVLSVNGLTAESPNTREERKGPRVDAPEKALEGFLRSTGLAKDQLEARDDKKGQVWFAVIEKPGRPAAEIIAELVPDVVRNFPWPKSMRWGAGSLRWVRPLHTILCILTDEAGAEVVPFSVDTITSGDTTRGHRFMAPDAFSVTSFEDYAAKLKRAHVVLEAAERADAIWNDATNQAFAAGLEVVDDKGLLAEVAGLVEWPVVLMGEIAEDFLDLPPEVLQTSMKEHQKFFSVRNGATGRIERFVTVANRETADQGATILAGNAKVLSARLADAKFFWENDLRVATSDINTWVQSLDNVTFHNKLGSQLERIERIKALAGEIAPSVGADAETAATAAGVAKADLSSEMVYEFPELQGLMGRYYATHAGLPAEVAAVCEEHYAPLGPSDDVPTAPVSVAVALADKIDLLTGFWAIEEKPTGSKDPFALRRAALGVIRLVLENGARMNLSEVLAKGYPGADVADLLSFIYDRLKVYLRDQGIRHDVIDACLAMPGADDLALLVARARALNDVLATEDGENLVQGFKRASNILSQAEAADGVEYSFGADVKFAEMDEEKALFAALTTAEGAISPAIEAEDFAGAMGAMAQLRGPVDAFFDAVQVNAESEILRRNRLNLLSQIRTICSQVADLTKLTG